MDGLRAHRKPGLYLANRTSAHRLVRRRVIRQLRMFTPTRSRESYAPLGVGRVLLLTGGGRREPGFDLGEVLIRQNDAGGSRGQFQVWRSTGRTGDNSGHFVMVQQPCESKGTAFDSVSALCLQAEPINRVVHGGGQQLIDPVGSQRHPGVWGWGGVALVLPGECTAGQRGERRER